MHAGAHRRLGRGHIREIVTQRMARANGGALVRLATCCLSLGQHSLVQGLTHNMAMTKRLLIVYHSATGSTLRMLDAVVAGATDPEITGIEVCVRAALWTSADEVRGAAGILLGTPENFGYMSGALKDFFDRIYYPCLEHTQGLPYGVFIRAGNDGTGALNAIERIVTGLRWRAIGAPLIVKGELTEATLADCALLGQTMAAGIEAGIF
jgi:flavorubredoxin